MKCYIIIRYQGVFFCIDSNIHNNINGGANMILFLLRKDTLLLSLHSAFCFNQSIAEFDLRTVRYEVKSHRCHELSLATPPNDRITFNFRCEREAQEWATVVMSSLREAHRGQSASPPLFLCQFCLVCFRFCALLGYG